MDPEHSYLAMKQDTFILFTVYLLASRANLPKEKYPLAMCVEFVGMVGQENKKNAIHYINIIFKKGKLMSGKMLIQRILKQSTRIQNIKI